MEDLIQQSVYVLVPVHNRKSITLDCLQNLKQNGDLEKYQVVVIDDGSLDGTDIAIRDQYPQAIVLEGDGNLWWTGAIAKGMQYAATHRAEFAIWLNDDCILEPNALSILVEFLYSHPQTIAGAVCYSLETQTLEETGAQGRKRVTANPGEIVAVNEMSGYCVGIPIEVIKAIGVPNQSRFPHYYGDCTYILKATRLGFPAYILGDVKITNQGSQPSIADRIACIKFQRSTLEIFKEIFLHKKSPYYLKSYFFYYMEKYGIIQGIPLFLIKTSIRIFEIIIKARDRSK
jgi:GT2 family glycosyltransferase